MQQLYAFHYQLTCNQSGELSMLFSHRFWPADTLEAGVPSCVIAGAQCVFVKIYKWAGI